MTVVKAAFTKALRRSTTRLVWWFERNRPYPIRSQWNSLPAIAVPSEADLRVQILATPSTCDEAAWCAWSWAKHSGMRHSIDVLVDGAIDPSFTARLSRIVPGAEVRAMHTLLGEWEGYSHLRSLCERHPLGRKLVTILGEQIRADVVFSDCDVLLFRRPTDLAQHVRSRVCCYNQERGAPAYDESIIRSGSTLGMKPSLRLNSGLLYIAKGSLQPQLAEELLLRQSSESQESWFVEQTIMAFLMEAAGAVPLDATKYVVSPQRQFWWEEDVDYGAIHTRHFTGTVRPLLYSRGYACLQAAAGE